MTRRRHEQLGQLAILARMLYQNDQTSLQNSAHLKQQTEGKLDLLNQSLAAIPVWDSVAAAQAALAYESWADAQRREINLELAQRTAVWLDAREASRASFGRKIAVDKLLKSKP